jgi:hypothetical protein
VGESQTKEKSQAYHQAKTEATFGQYWFQLQKVVLRQQIMDSHLLQSWKLL